MTFNIGDKVQTNSGLYMNGAWREAGLKGKVVESPNEYGSLTVKFKGMDVNRFIRSSYLTLRKRKAEKVAAEELIAVERERPFQVGDSVVFKKTVMVGLTVEVVEGIWAEVVELIPDSNLVVVEFDDYGTLTVAEEVLATEAETFGEEEETPPAPDFDEKSLEFAEDSPEVQEALALILERIEEIKTLLTTKPQHEVQITFNEASFVTAEEEEEPEPEPVFKKAKEVNEGDLMYTEAGAWDKVNRIETKDSGYTSLYGVFGNKIAQVPSGRVVQVLEPVS